MTKLSVPEKGMSATWVVLFLDCFSTSAKCSDVTLWELGVILIYLMTCNLFVFDTKYLQELYAYTVICK